MNAIATLARPAGWLGFFGLILAAWWVMYILAGAMGLTLTGGMRPGAGALVEMRTAAVIVPMWMIMMAAMMAPVFVPTMRTYEDLIAGGAGSRKGLFGLVAGFVLVWLGAGALIGLVHAALFRAGLADGMGVLRSGLASAGLLAAAGAYQFSRFKDACLAQCRSPMTFFLAHWRGGFSGGMRMGARAGALCVGCCWLIMALGFVGGAMNLLWMGIATLIVTLEKLPEIGRWMTRPLGAAFFAAAAWQLATLV